MNAIVGEANELCCLQPADLFTSRNKRRGKASRRSVALGGAAKDRAGKIRGNAEKVPGKGWKRQNIGEKLVQPVGQRGVGGRAAERP